MASIPDPLQSAAETLRNGGSLDPVTVRTLLAWFGFERRGKDVVTYIRNALRATGLVTEPDFDAVWLDSPIRFRPMQSEHVEQAEQSTEVPEFILDEPAQASFVGGAVPDPTHKVGKLEAANHGVISVTPDDTIERAVTLMMANRFSQLPVMTSEREVKGMVT
jgi:CBS domain-containing protein